MTVTPGLARVRWWYLRGLGFVFCLAFASLLPQLPALVGPQGLSPATELLDWGRESLGGAERLLRLPTLLWLTGASTGALRGVALLGLGCGVLLLLDVAPRYALVGAWGLSLSLTTVGGVFLGFQWDVLLLEAALVSLPRTPPRYVRTRRLDYRFTDLATLRATGAWWTRQQVGPYCPPLTLRDGRLQRADPPSSP
ncbi:lipase maturation factor family protein [Pyxidicoccus xibeiensis]|uniref:lipase maturation factor family protein n=1 Tax=Pyxidicoccus xibeiensis TaxID=2906759 RepID=UPI0020A77980|nr:lipase maturation factor family protein [Pyxidicoccus xibeiensis]MCP3140475.1 lipase maturation factor family protein [Pyxidicoccus xibeiensis]